MNSTHVVVNNGGLLQAGLAYFSVKDVYDTNRENRPLITKSGHPMITVALMVTDKNGITETIYDYISSNLTWKLEGIKKACGINEELYSSAIEVFNKNALLGKSGYCSIKESQSEQYPGRMGIATYLPPDFHLIVKKNSAGHENKVPIPADATFIKNTFGTLGTIMPGYILEDDIPF